MGRASRGRRARRLSGALPRACRSVSQIALCNSHRWQRRRLVGGAVWGSLTQVTISSARVSRHGERGRCGRTLRGERRGGRASSRQASVEPIHHPWCACHPRSEHEVALVETCLRHRLHDRARIKSGSASSSARTTTAFSSAARSPGCPSSPWSWTRPARWRGRWQLVAGCRKARPGCRKCRFATVWLPFFIPGRCDSGGPVRASRTEIPHQHWESGRSGCRRSPVTI